MVQFRVIIAITLMTALVMAKPFEDQVQIPNSKRASRQAGGGHHHDAVDFGAHTGDHGAFGWYADFPVHGH